MHLDDVEDVMEEGDEDFNEDEDDDGPLKTGGVLVVELIGEDLKEFM